MIDKNTLVKDLDRYVYIGEYDDLGAFGKLADKKVFIDNKLSHTDISERCLLIYTFKYRIHIIHDLIQKLFPDDLEISREVRSVGQGFYGFEIHFHDHSLEYVVDVLSKIYLHIKLTNCFRD
jgi:hypothetical protein